jgi:hypothetical protein
MSGRPYFRSEEMAVFFGTLKPKAELNTIPNLDHLLVVMDQAEIEVSFTDSRRRPVPDQPTTRLSPSGLLWVPGNRIETIRNLRAQPSSYMLVSFKDSAVNGKRESPLKVITSSPSTGWHSFRDLASTLAVAHLNDTLPGGRKLCPYDR